MRKFLLSFGCFCILSLSAQYPFSTLYAEEKGDSTEYKYNWIEIGAGFSTFSAGSSGMNLSFSMSNKRNIASLRFNYFEEFKICVFSPCTTRYNLYTLSGTYGYIHSGEIAMASISAGLSLNVGKGKSGTIITPGIPVETQLFLTITPWLGFGIFGFADLNVKEPYAGTVVCLQIGKLK